MDSTTSLMILLLLSVLSTSAAQIFQKRAALRGATGENKGRAPANSARSIAETTGIRSRLRFADKLPVISSDLLISIVLLACGLAFWMLVLTRLDVSVAYPVLSINYVLVLLAGKFLFNEPVFAHQWFGAFSIVAGIVLLLGGMG